MRQWTWRTLTISSAACLCVVAFSPTTSAAPVLFAGNGHYYEFIEQTAISFNAARTAAESAGGYLATITSAAENAFIFALSGLAGSTTGGSRVWLGGSDAVSEGTTEGHWIWVTGPEAGQEFFDDTSNTTLIYSNWGAGEPNNDSPLGQQYLVMVRNSVSGQWDDIANNPDATNIGAIAGYVVEYDAPEPVTLALLGLGLAALALRRRPRN